MGKLAFCRVSLNCDCQVGAGRGETRGKRPPHANRWGSGLWRPSWKWEEGWVWEILFWGFGQAHSSWRLMRKQGDKCMLKMPYHAGVRRGDASSYFYIRVRLMHLPHTLLRASRVSHLSATTVLLEGVADAVNPSLPYSAHLPLLFLTRVKPLCVREGLSLVLMHLALAQAGWKQAGLNTPGAAFNCWCAGAGG